MKAYTLVKLAKENEYEHREETPYEREQRLAKKRYHQVMRRSLVNPIAGLVEGAKLGHEDVGLWLGPAGLNGARAKDTGIDTLGTTVEQGLKWNIPINAVFGGALGAVTGHIAGDKALKYGLVGATGGGVAGGTIGAAGDYIGYKAGKKFAEKQELKEHHHEG